MPYSMQGPLKNYWMRMELFNLKTGMCGKVETIVTDSNTASKFGSGKLEVFGTPAMVAIMEEAAVKAVDSYLPEGYLSVGIALDVKHIAATPPGMSVRAVAELEEIDGKKLTFKVEAFDSREKIGEGTHKRYIVELADFVKRAASKKGL